MTRAASIIIRTKDRVATVERTLRYVRDQTVGAEIVVVDSGSTDGTLDIVRRYADVLVEIEPAAFTFGGALNAGAERASGDVHFALSSHSFPYSRSWVEDSLALYARDDVAGTCGSRDGPDGSEIDYVYHQTAQDAVDNAWWGISNHGSSWRASVWADIPFRADLPANEDKEWGWRVLAAGWTIAFAPTLEVSNTHRRRAGAAALARRVVTEKRTFRALGVRPGPVSGIGGGFFRSPAYFRLVEGAAAQIAKVSPAPAIVNPGLDALRQQVAAQGSGGAAGHQVSGPAAP